MYGFKARDIKAPPRLGAAAWLGGRQRLQQYFLEGDEKSRGAGPGGRFFRFRFQFSFFLAEKNTSNPLNHVLYSLGKGSDTGVVYREERRGQSNVRG